MCSKNSTDGTSSSTKELKKLQANQATLMQEARGAQKQEFEELQNLILQMVKAMENLVKHDEHSKHDNGVKVQIHNESINQIVNALNGHELSNSDHIHAAIQTACSEIVTHIESVKLRCKSLEETESKHHHILQDIVQNTCAKVDQKPNFCDIENN